MILIDALYINGGGGKVLLDYLISELEKTDKKVLFLLDKRIKNDLYQSEKNTFIFLKASLLNRKNFYKAEKNKFTSILCFGNLPPNVNVRAKVYTYFHQLLYLQLPKDMSLLQKAVFKLKVLILKSIKTNTNYWMVQTELVKKSLSNKYHIPRQNILVLPFYPPMESGQKVSRKDHQYIYVSNAPPYKNHIRLIEAFCIFFDLYKMGNLIVTVSNDYPEVVKIINQKIALGYPIENIGFIKREELSAFYQNSKYIIYPSLAESFGLGLVEAIENGCFVLGADLPYTKVVCEPSLLFDPLSVDEIVKALSLSLQNDLKPPVNKIKNNITEIISLLD